MAERIIPVARAVSQHVSAQRNTCDYMLLCRWEGKSQAIFTYCMTTYNSAVDMVNASGARAMLPGILDRVEAGEEITTCAMASRWPLSHPHRLWSPAGR